MGIHCQRARGFKRLDTGAAIPIPLHALHLRHGSPPIPARRPIVRRAPPKFERGMLRTHQRRIELLDRGVGVRSRPPECARGGINREGDARSQASPQRNRSKHLHMSSPRPDGMTMPSQIYQIQTTESQTLADLQFIGYDEYILSDKLYQVQHLSLHSALA